MWYKVSDKLLINLALADRVETVEVNSVLEPYEDPYVSSYLLQPAAENVNLTVREYREQAESKFKAQMKRFQERNIVSEKYRVHIRDKHYDLDTLPIELNI